MAEEPRVLDSVVSRWSRGWPLELGWGDSRGVYPPNAPSDPCLFCSVSRSVRRENLELPRTSLGCQRPLRLPLTEL